MDPDRVTLSATAPLMTDSRAPRGRAVRLGAVMGALIVPTVVGLLVGAFSASLCTGGLECLGSVIYGAMAGILFGVIAAVFVARWLRIPWPQLGALLGGWIVLGATYAMIPRAFLSGGSTMMLWLGLAALWPMVLGLAWGPDHGRLRWVAATAALGAVLVFVPLLAWVNEADRVDSNQHLLATSKATLLGPVGDELGCLGPFTAYDDGRHPPDAFTYKLVEADLHEWYVHVPVVGDLTLEQFVERGDALAFRARLEPVSRDWLATCSTPLHRWALNRGLWGNRSGSR